MSNLRFYSPPPLQIGATVTLSENAATHATKVMRLSVGDSLVLFCGDGADYTCELTTVQKSAVMAKVKSRQILENESPLDITLLLGISAGDRMDIAIQKAVELGVNRIIPIKTERSVVKLDEDKAKKRVAHWQNIAIAACEQSGRAVVPQVDTPATLPALLAKPCAADTLRITLDPLADKKLADLTKPEGEIQLLIGAEGGLSANEITLASQHDFIGVQLGRRILRTETAPLAAIAVMNTLWGDF
ncbi:MAG TPA: 16S rRNA (uracil(1498)-N(3))-methyltransferase [Methylophilus sp.]|nr:16S rRNA (uracil(1498)-N(3))-methyltransferase [Methylophilus sp.]HQQ33125.1 16S rRNA (uracil(1498)-N(3))-methyltransferase [Methylophilus sp.]